VNGTGNSVMAELPPHILLRRPSDVQKKKKKTHLRASRAGRKKVHSNRRGRIKDDGTGLFKTKYGTAPTEAAFTIPDEQRGSP